MSILILVPTEKELDALSQWVPSDGPHPIQLKTCGFGLLAASIRTSELIAKQPPRQILLAGIAGVYSGYSDLVGTACCFQKVIQYGIGSFNGAKIVSPEESGFATRDLGTIPLTLSDHLPNLDLLVSVTASRLFSEAEILSTFPDASAEDMEAYAVAAVAQFHGIPLTVIRGISNVVGTPFNEWKIEAAINEAGRFLSRWIKRFNQETE